MLEEFRLAEERTVAVVGEHRVEMSWDLWLGDDAPGSCITGTARVNGNAYDVGGGWVSSDGSVEPYEGWEIDGASDEFRKLVEALYGPGFGEDQERALRDALAAAIPDLLTMEEVLRETGRRIAMFGGEWDTKAIYEFDGEYFYGAHNGGDQGELFDDEVEAFHVVSGSEVMERLLDWGHTPEEIEAMLAEGAEVESE